MKQYMAGIVVLGYGPLLYAIIYYFSDVWNYLTDDEEAEIQIWQVIIINKYFFLLLFLCSLCVFFFANIFAILVLCCFFYL